MRNSLREYGVSDVDAARLIEGARDGRWVVKAGDAHRGAANVDDVAAAANMDDVAAGDNDEDEDEIDDADADELANFADVAEELAEDAEAEVEDLQEVDDEHEDVDVMDDDANDGAEAWHPRTRIACGTSPNKCCVCARSREPSPVTDGDDPLNWVQCQAPHDDDPAGQGEQGEDGSDSDAEFNGGWFHTACVREKYDDLVASGVKWECHRCKDKARRFAEASLAEARRAQRKEAAEARGAEALARQRDPGSLEQKSFSGLARTRTGIQLSEQGRASPARSGSKGCWRR